MVNVKNAELIELGGGAPSLICRTSRLPEGWVPITFLSLGVVACFGLAYYVYFNFHEFHFHLSRQDIPNYLKAIGCVIAYCMFLFSI